MTPFPSKQRDTSLNHFISLFITKILLLMTLNFLFILTSIPLFTIPISFSSMQKVIHGILSEKEQPSVFKAYFTAFKTDFLKSTILGIPFILILVGLGYASYYYYMNSTSVFFLGLSVFCILLLLLVYSVALMAFQMIPSVDLPIKSIVKNALILNFSFPMVSLICAIGSLAIVITGLWFFPYSTPLLLLIVFSFSSYFVSFIVYPVIQKNIIKR